MEQSPFWQTNKSSASQEIPALYLTQSINTASNTRPQTDSWFRAVQTMPPHPTA